MSTIVLERPASSVPLTTNFPSATISSRLLSIDFLRGLIMVIMALDHVRDFVHFDAYLYYPLDETKTSGILYITRWITHFCAPTFILLAGTSAYLMGQNKTKKQLSSFLFTRGLWLLLAEMTFISFSWSFNPQLGLFGVIAAIGVCMMLLSLLIWLPYVAILLVGLSVIFLHNVLNNMHVASDASDALKLGWAIVHDPGLFKWEGYSLFVGYSILPWVGVMAAGYSLGALFRKGYDAARRRLVLQYTGIVAILAFLVLRYLNIYGNPTGWKSGADATASVMIFFNVLKYPASLQYLLITLGPVLLLLSVLDKVSLKPSNPLVIIGKVPFFYYVIHLYIIHLVAVVIALSTGHPFGDMVTETFVTDSAKLKGTYGLSLIWVYVTWVLLVLALYPLCKWYAGYKQQHKEKKWLSYL